jgi:hypothetical protein
MAMMAINERKAGPLARLLLLLLKVYVDTKFS